jgi:hypothetical protein
MKRLQRTQHAFAAITLFVYVAGVVYHHFGRGMFSLAMDHAFHYPLFLGLFFNMLLMRVQERLPFVGTSGYRLYANIYNAGIAALTIRAYVFGILEIASTESSLLGLLSYVGWGFVGVGLLVLVMLFSLSHAARKHRRSRTYQRP